MFYEAAAAHLSVQGRRGGVGSKAFRIRARKTSGQSFPNPRPLTDLEIPVMYHFYLGLSGSQLIGLRLSLAGMQMT